jgi:predicted transcriptional regulator
MNGIMSEAVDKSEQTTRYTILESIRQGEEDKKRGNVLSNAQVVKKLEQEFGIDFELKDK